MSRTIEQIENSVIEELKTQTDLTYVDNLSNTVHITTNTSRRAIWRLWASAQASVILLFEQMLDLFKAENEDKISKAIPMTIPYLTKKVYEFQYSVTNPQVIQMLDYAPLYPVIDTSLRLITRASIVTSISGKVLIKVAKNEPPSALSIGELSNLQSYINLISVPGINYTCVSSEADRLYIDCDVYYDGQYSSVIQSTVTNSINVFLANLPFNGQLKISDLEIAIRNSTGVNDVLFKNLKIRANATVFISGTYMVQNNTVISRLFPTSSGYVILEDTVSNNINFIAS